MDKKMNLTKKIKQEKYFFLIIIASIITYNTSSATADQIDKITLTPIGSNFCNNAGCVYTASSNFYIINIQNAVDRNIKLTNKWPKQYPLNQLSRRTFPGTLDFKVIPYNRYLPNKFTIMVGDSVFAFKSREIDSGGGIITLTDGGIGDTNDEQVNDMITPLQSDNIPVDCNDGNFLKDCYYIKDGETIKITNPGFEKDYTYNVSNSDYRKVALYPKNTAQTIPANFGVNQGSLLSYFAVSPMTL
jgi:hypothetical protein